MMASLIFRTSLLQQLLDLYPEGPRQLIQNRSSTECSDSDDDDVPEAEQAKIVAENTARVYRFDVAKLTR
jgi:hypothetical protein